MGIRLLVVAAALLALFAVAGCGDSGSDTASQEQLEAARDEGEEKAREQERVDDLQRQVRKLKKRVDGRAAAAAAAPVAATPAAVASAPSDAPAESREAFHAPSGNVSCEVFSDSALCTVASVDLTFTLAGGEAARVESGSTLSRGTGRLAPFGTSVRIGSITCEIPHEDEPRGITCTDTSSGHGFEASRHSDRQRVY